MTSPWDLYDQLIDEIPADITVTQIFTDGKWRRVASSEDGVGMAFGMNVQSRPRATEDPADLVGRPLRDVAALAKSWNFEDAGIGMAAVNAYHSHPVRALAHGFRPCKENNWARTFHPYASLVAGKRVAIIGHFPFAPAASPTLPSSTSSNATSSRVTTPTPPANTCFPRWTTSSSPDPHSSTRPCRASSSSPPTPTPSSSAPPPRPRPRSCEPEPRPSCPSPARTPRASKTGWPDAPSSACTTLA